MIRGLVADKRILVCAGPGGVGKTTTAAALGALAARLGKKTLVCTIDPAPRLADALGVGGLGSEPRPVPAEACRALGIQDGQDGQDPRLWAVRLDTARAFARLVDEQVADPVMRRRVFENTIYRQITTSLTGSQEYAATLALYELARERRYDLIVLDTPPTANALDFLDAPKRIAAAVSSPALKWFARPPSGGGLSFQRLRMGGALVLRRLGKLVGSTFLEDLAAFLVDFQDVLAGFLTRAQAVDALLRSAEAAFLLVLAPVGVAVEEALYFHGRLQGAGVPVAGFVANRVQPAPGLTDATALRDALRASAAYAELSDQAVAAAAARLASLAREFQAIHATESRALERLAARAAATPVIRIPLLDHDADNLAELKVVGDSLLAG
ncbi:MAG TPA: ArsA-related P-loop ATPase [Polyangia bacterium]|nr:ArsA-related P-loop ATPase [Polyangia bacterium]